MPDDRQSVESLHATFRLMYDKLNSQTTPGLDEEEIDQLLTWAQDQIQHDEYRAYRNADGRGFENGSERTSNLDVFINADPLQLAFGVKVPPRVSLPPDYRYTATAEVCWTFAENVFYPIRLYTHDEWKVAARDPFNCSTYFDPIMVQHSGQLELQLPSTGLCTPGQCRIWYLRYAKTISLALGQGMELNGGLQERLVQAAVMRAKLLTESPGAQYQTALNKVVQ